MRRRRARASSVFISYRREDASGFAGRLHEDLCDHFGPERVFRDVDTIEPGARFPERISESLRSCHAFVAVIGREWVVDRQGRRRLDDPADWVRVELESVLGRPEVLVVPVLVEDASMPAAGDIPGSLATLLECNALEISDSRWGYDVQRLTDSLEAVVGPAPTTWAATLRRALVPKSVPGALARVLVAAAVLVATIWGLVSVLRPSPGASAMTGDYNIAVAEFESVDERGRPVDSPEASGLAQSVHDVLQRELGTIEQGGFDLNVRGPAATGRVRGATPERRAVAAAALAKRIQADVVVYGVLRSDVPNQFSAEFFLNDRRLQNAEELFGQHQLGSGIRTAGDISKNPVIRKELRDRVLGRARALAEFIVGLSYYGANQPQPALDHFQAARDAAGWDEGDGKEVLYLFLGNAAGKLDNLDRAAASYDQALVLNPEYARARLGRAEVFLYRSRGACESGAVDAGGLRTALDTYRSARSAKVQPALSDVPTKVVFGEGRVLLCLSQALVADHFADAERAFQQVVAEFRAGNTRLREMAAESYAGLGFVHLPTVGEPNAAERYRQAAADYRSAIELVGDDDRKAFFHSMRGFVFGRLGEPAEAEKEYGLAARLARDPVARARYEQARQSPAGA